jgi:hypothetical protein
MPSPMALAVTLVMIVLAAIPTRRLSEAGFRPSSLLTYMVVVVALGLAIYFGAPAKYVAPVLIVVYVAPLLAPPELVGRMIRRRPGPPAGAGDASKGGSGSWAARGRDFASRARSARSGRPVEPKPVGSGPGRTVRPDGTVEPGEPDQAGEPGGEQRR